MGKANRRKNMESTATKSTATKSTATKSTATKSSTTKQEQRNTNAPMTMQLSWKKPVSILLGIICAVIAVGLYYLLISSDPGHIDLDTVGIDPDGEVIFVAGHQRASLFKPYAVDLDELMRERERNMERYSYNYSRSGIDKRSALSLQEFHDVYDGKWPVVITDVVPRWSAFNWTREFFFEKYGQERVTMKAVDDVLDQVIADMLPDVYPFTAADIALRHSASCDVAHHDSGCEQGSLNNAVSLSLPLKLFYINAHKAFPSTWTYVEDELFITTRPHLKKDIGQCDYMDEDFYQLFPKEIRPWNAMLLWGTKFSRSSLHIDPYNWTGTNAVIKGRKRWKLFPPGQDHLLSIKPNQLSGFPLNCYKYNSKLDTFDENTIKSPLFQQAESLEFDQHPGELLFIPTGWFHQAFNMEETIAVSSQVMNRNNFRIVLEEIIKVGNIKREQLPPDIDDMSPPEQVRAVMSLLPNHILERGREVTADALHQIKHGYDSSYLGM